MGVTMGDSHRSKIVIMQLFHELKQQFPTLPDYVVSQCIVQNSYDRELCARSLRASQNARPPPGAFPPPAPQDELQPSAEVSGLAGEATLVPKWKSPNLLSAAPSSHPSTSEGSTVEAVKLPEALKGLEIDVDLPPDEDQELVRLLYEPQPGDEYQPALILAEPVGGRSCSTSVSLTLRPPSSEPQTPIDVSSAEAGPFRAQISLEPQEPPIGRGAIPRTPRVHTYFEDEPDYQLPPELLEVLDQAEEEYKPLIRAQLINKHRMTKALEVEETKLTALKREIIELSKPSEEAIAEMERRLRSEIYQLQLECDRLAKEVDNYSDAQIPLGEVDEEFYKCIYTGQQCISSGTVTESTVLPSEQVAWESTVSSSTEQEDMDGPAWVCSRCTFDNHPLMNKCEECDMPRTVEGAQGTITKSTVTTASDLSSFPSTSS